MKVSKIIEVFERYKIEDIPAPYTPMYQLASHVVELEEKLKEETMNLNPLVAKMRMRGEVLKFAVEMEKKLDKNEHKGAWEETSSWWLMRRLVDEVEELREQLRIGGPMEVVEEAADVANFAMMIADNSGGLK
jgi:hypothetical protein